MNLLSNTNGYSTDTDTSDIMSVNKTRITHLKGTFNRPNVTTFQKCLFFIHIPIIM